MIKYKIECFHEGVYFIDADWFHADEDNTLTLFVMRDGEEFEVACFNRAHWNLIIEVKE